MGTLQVASEGRFCGFLIFRSFASSELIQRAGGRGAIFWSFSVASATVNAHQPDSLEWCRMLLKLLFNRGYTPFGFKLPVSGLCFFYWIHGNRGGWYSILHLRGLLCVVPLKAFVLRHLRHVTIDLSILIAALNGMPESQATLFPVR